MNDDDLKRMMSTGIEPATDLAKRRTVKQVSERFTQHMSVLKQGYRSKIALGCLVAISMFGALSYTVTQSTRSGAGSSDNETGLINSAQLTQYPAGVRSAVVRMIIGGVATETIRFDLPENLAFIRDHSNQVFAKTGGGATYAEAPAEVMAEDRSGQWVFNMELSLPHIGSGDADISAYLVGISQDVCLRINDELGITKPIPQLRHEQTDLYIKNMTSSYTVANSPAPVLDAPELDGQPCGCFQSHDGNSYVYYHVLVER